MHNQTSKNFPNSWNITTIDQIGKVVTGGTPSTKNRNFFGSDFPFFKPADLNNGYYVKKSFDGLTKEGIEHARLIPERSILVTCIGATIGKTGFNRVKGATNQQINSIIPYRDFIFPEYIYFLLCSPIMQKKIIDNSSSTTLPILNKSKFEKLEIPLAPFNEQKRIVSKLDELFTKLDSGIEYLKKTKILLGQYRQSFLKHSFEGKLTDKWRGKQKDKFESRTQVYEIKRSIKNPRKNVVGSHEEKLWKLPNTWTWVKLNEISELNPRPETKFPDDLEVSFLPMKYVDEETGKIDLSLSKKLIEVRNGFTPFIDGDIIFAKITPCMENGKIAIVNGLKNGIGYGSTEFHVIRLSTKLSRKFFFFYLLREDLRKDAQRNMKGTAGQLRVPLSYMENISLPFPPIEEQNQIMVELEHCLSIIDDTENIIHTSLSQGTKLRDCLLRYSFEGKLVPQDPTDEPAEILLDKIKKEKSIIENKNNWERTKNKSDPRQMRLV